MKMKSAFPAAVRFLDMNLKEPWPMKQSWALGRLRLRDVRSCLLPQPTGTALRKPPGRVTVGQHIPRGCFPSQCLAVGEAQAGPL